MAGYILLFVVTLLYAGYNLMVKQSSAVAATTGVGTITATIVLQLVALLCSLLFWFGLRMTTDESHFALPHAAYVWAALAGVCIGAAEIGYFYLFRGSALAEAMPVSVATPVVVGGTVVIAMVAALLFFSESISVRQWIGAAVVVAGVLLITS